VSKKLGFWAVFSIVTGSQIGSGVFMLPANLAPFGAMSIIGWIISGIGAISLALIFAQLCSWLPKTGGPHAYVNEAFGQTAAFFTGWTYWVISWVSSTAVIIAAIGYLTPVIGDQSLAFRLALEIILLAIITMLNFRGLKAAGDAEFILTVLKIIPLVLIPLAALYFFDAQNFVMEPHIAAMPVSRILNQVTLLTLWGFIGLESATTPAGSVENPTKTIPRAVVLGTISVALLYLLNSVGIMGVVPGEQLALSKAPYGDATHIIFGGNWHIIIALIASVICIGTLNAWMMASGQIALGVAQDNLMPAFFAKKNKFDAPFVSLAISAFGILPFLILTADVHIARQINMIIDFSVTAFIFVYMICCFAFFKLLWQNRRQQRNFGLVLAGVIALIFSGWIMWETSLTTLLTALLFTASGIPIYLYHYRFLNK
jgi:APA family basic amino acid/polyamine antiporter